MEIWERLTTKTARQRASFRVTAAATAIAVLVLCGAGAWAQTDCAEGDGVLDTAAPKTLTAPEVIQKFTAQETKVKLARDHYTYTQDVMVQTLGDKGSVDGQFHEIASISYDDKGKRAEKVTYAEQSTLRGVQLTQEDMQDIREFMQWILTTNELPQYNLTYSGQQHVDDLDTYVFHVVPKKEEKGKRYFEGRIWVDNRDFQIVKLCGKSVPDAVRPKKNKPMDVRLMFVGYRQLVDGLWFPAYARVDDTLHFMAQSVHLREVVKLKDYKKALAGAPAP
jgi:hypothetical protein